MIKRLVLCAVFIIALSISAFAGRTVPSGYVCVCNPGPNNEVCLDDGGQMMPECFSRLVLGRASLPSTPDAGSLLLFSAVSLIIIKRRYRR